MEYDSRKHYDNAMVDAYPRAKTDDGKDYVPLPKERPAEAGLSSADYDKYGLDRRDYSRGLRFKFPGWN